MQIITIETPSLGNRGYIVHDGTHAISIDPQRDYERWNEIITKHTLTLTHVFETHMHNDYVTGGKLLAEATNAQYVIPNNSGAQFSADTATDNTLFTSGTLTVRALHTPGHTPHHLSYEVKDGSESAVFTGGSLLYGTVGRPDLVSNDVTNELAHNQYTSAQKLRSELSASTQVFPTHGFGSFCASAPGTGADASTIESEVEHNIAFTAKSEDEFVEKILAGLEAYPRYYAQMGPLNREGPGVMKFKEPKDLEATALARMLSHGEWIVDIRDRKAYATSHPVGASGIELGQSFGTYMGWLIPWGSSVTLVGDDKDAIREAQTQLGRIGMDQFIGAVSTDMETYLSSAPTISYRVANFNDLHAARSAQEPLTILDVRAPREHTESHIEDAINIPIYELPERLNELKNKQQPIWVHCASGYRASIAASLLDRASITPVLIDDTYSPDKA